LGLLTQKWIVVVALLFLELPSFPNWFSGFIPNEDRGIILADVTLPPGSTLENTEKYCEGIRPIIESMDIVEARDEHLVSSFTNNNGGPTFLRNKFKDWSERTEDGQL
jgi:HAE1 family hydrophobic/amphiphilic exporter-1